MVIDALFGDINPLNVKNKFILLTVSVQYKITEIPSGTKSLSSDVGCIK
jgi:hypothetical protein